jgi:hypothetical protein
VPRRRRNETAIFAMMALSSFSGSSSPTPAGKGEHAATPLIAIVIERSRFCP